MMQKNLLQFFPYCGIEITDLNLFLEFFTLHFFKLQNSIFVMRLLNYSKRSF
jgi:hypothetical protein